MTKEIRIGNVVIGGGRTIAVQSMTTTRTKDVEATVGQIARLTAAGCDIVRVAVLNEADAAAIKAVKNGISIPLVADIHFDYRLAVSAMEHGADKIRFNPGNIGDTGNVKKVVDAAKQHRVPIRVGVNSGSIEKEILSAYGSTAEGLAESALAHVRLLEQFAFTDIVISAKASSVSKTIEAYRILAEKTSYPLHLGVTEAGTYESAIIKSAAGIGGLLAMGIGDTVRVSITGEPVQEVAAAREILRAVGADKNFVEVVSCPTCGRCQIDLEKAVQAVREHTRLVRKPLKVAVMGCVVNGIGEGRDADIGLAGGKGSAVLFKHGEMLRTVAEEEMIPELLREIDTLLGVSI